MQICRKFTCSKNCELASKWKKTQVNLELCRTACGCHTGRCAQTLFALRNLRQHGMPTCALRTVFQATVVNKLSYAVSAWWGFASAADRGRLEAFLRRYASFGYRDPTAPSLAYICEQADDKLFNNILCNNNHLLRPLLPPDMSQQYP